MCVVVEFSIQVLIRLFLLYVLYLSTSRDGTSHITYSLIQPCSQEGQPVVSVGPNGEINTAGFNGHAVVMVTADELDMGLNQTVLVHIEVRKSHVWVYMYMYTG